MRVLLPFVLLFASFAVLGQANKKVKIYAYEQQVLPGVRKITLDESGKEKEVPPKNILHYFIFMEAPASKKVEAKHLWIRGKLYSINIEKPALPVVVNNLTYPTKKADTLVRQRLDPVVQLVPATATDNFAATYSVKKKMKKNAIVLHTVENGKDCYYYLEGIKRLDPVAMQ
ncbi:MAG TPA: hypothetical protein VJT83_03780 [Chitinophagaceae bacterium]|nr:hypothetical protein [Chitinophagaceae bacterium]